MITFIKCFI